MWLQLAVICAVLIAVCQADVVNVNIPVPSQQPQAPFEDAPLESDYNNQQYNQLESNDRVEINQHPESNHQQESSSNHKLWANLENVTFTFDCRGRPMGFYADVEFNCQIFHMCDEVGSRIPHVCANETSFNQEYRICDWDYNFDCNQSENWYYLNELTYATDPPKAEDEIQQVEEKSEQTPLEIVPEEILPKERSFSQVEYPDYLDAPIVAE